MSKCTSSLLRHVLLGRVLCSFDLYLLSYSSGFRRITTVPYIIMSNFSHFATKAIHIGNEPDQWKCHAVVPPIFLSTTFEEQEPAVTYVRFLSTIFTYLPL
jgi:hypothetical protein